ncbi:hypothetical protein GT347_15420 [Xylophilus rhododendri]|uniref:Uncharacterized protein n=1 Tax=Xylophilus rhododendri TaxID=2697032 RepID=A0A857J7M7_9BURK|nr:hypothetical protein [Xylophilus rhododendri]QHI99243.1 hypothetical protein GT347_15420 [Xylophilus rhododendri]
MPTKLGQWLDGRKAKNELKKRIQDDAATFDKLIKEAVALAGKLPEPQRRGGAAQLQLLRDRLTEARLLKDRQKRADGITQLVGETREWIAKASAPVTPQQPPPQPQQPIQTLGEAIRTLTQDAKAMAQAVRQAQLAVPAAMESAIAAGDKLLDPKTAYSTTNSVKGQQALKAIVDARAKVEEFLDAWKAAGPQELQNRAALPDPKALFQPLEAMWPLRLAEVTNAWASMADTATAERALQQLRSGQNTLAQYRQGLLGQHQGAAARIEAVSERIGEAGAMKIYELAPARLLLKKAQADYVGADSSEKLTAVTQALQAAEAAIEKAKADIGEARVKAMEKFGKQRRALADQLAAARLVRGALDEQSAVFAEIGKIQKELEAADRDLGTSVTSAAIDRATKLLDEAIAKDIAKAAEKLSKDLKKQAEADLAALPAYQKAFAQLQSVRTEVAGINGGHVQLQAIDALMVRTRVDAHGQPPGGFKAAAQTLADAKIGEFVAKARKAEKDFIAKELSPAGKKALEAADKAVLLYGRCHPQSMVDAQKRAIALALQAPNPEAGLGKITEDLTEAASSQQEELARMGRLTDAIEKGLDELVKQGFPAGSADLAELGRQIGAVRAALADWRVESATTLLDKLQDLAVELGKDFAKAKQDWTGIYEQLKPVRSRAAQLSKATGAIAGPAKGLFDNIEQTLAELQDGRIDHRTAVEMARRYLQRGADQDRVAEEAKFPPGFDFDEFRIEAGKLTQLWNTRAKGLREQIERLNQALLKQGLKGGAGSLGWGARLTELQKQRDEVDRALQPRLGEPTLQTLVRSHNELMQQLADLAASLPDPAQTADAEFKQALKDGQAREANDAWAAKYRGTEQLLLEIEKAADAPQKALRQQLQAFEQASTDPKQAEALEKLRVSFAQKVIEKRRLIAADKAPARNEAQKLKSEVAKKFMNLQADTFRDLFKDLGQRVDDALAMLDTDDPLLIEAARREIDLIRLTVDDAKGKGDKAGASLDQVQKAWAKLSHTLGDDAVVQKRLPRTYAGLKERLDKAIEAAKRLPPDQGLAALDQLAEPIGQAREAALAAQVKYDGFKLRKEAVEALFDKMKDHTGATLLGGRAKAYNERFASRLSDAHATARQEGELEAALQQLAALETELDGLMAQKPDEARASLQELNADAAEEQRELRDLARNWNSTQSYWIDSLVPAVESAVKQRKVEAEEQEVESLKAAVNSIGRSLAPYLDVVSKVPHKRGLSNGAPDMKAARAAFAQAYMRIGQLNKTALRLREGGASTNVDLVRDLQKLEQEWVRRVGELRGTLGQLSESMKQLPAKASATEDHEDYLSPADKQKLETAVGQITPMLDRLANRFPAGAFAGPLKVLAAQDSSLADRKKAREQALRTTRQLGADVVDNPLFVQLFRGAAAGMVDVDPRPAISFVRAALKKIELAALVGI